MSMDIIQYRKWSLINITELMITDLYFVSVGSSIATNLQDGTNLTYNLSKDHSMK